MSIFHSSFVKHFSMKVLWVGVDNFQIVIALCCALSQGNLVDFRFCIVIVVDWLERWCRVKVIDVSARISFRFVWRWWIGKFSRSLRFNRDENFFEKNSPPLTINTKKMHQTFAIKRENTFIVSRGSWRIENGRKFNKRRCWKPENYFHNHTTSPNNLNAMFNFHWLRKKILFSLWQIFVAEEKRKATRVWGWRGKLMRRELVSVEKTGGVE